LWHEQKKVSEMQDTELTAYVLDSKDKMPLRKPFPHSHKAAEDHKRLRRHLGEWQHTTFIVDSPRVLHRGLGLGLGLGLRLRLRLGLGLGLRVKG
jgi:hypothetical protein